ncbi:MAG: DNase [Candidatus Aenigmarchaeota archaeon ex4484_56]|nr:MAG: DNase [Candidatus Aenigmarchaeota archaeon ex4484_56]
MIDVHCHLEQKDFDRDRENIITECKKEMEALIISCAYPHDFEKSLAISEKYKKFVFLTAGFHPEYIRDFTDTQIDGYLKKIEENKKHLVGIGECGLDYYWVKDADQIERQKVFFIKQIELSKKLNLPLIIHSRESTKDCLDLLEKLNYNKVLLHFFSDKNFINYVIEKDFHISVNTSVLRSKSIKKIVKHIKIERIMTETDSPWLGFGKRNTPLSVKSVIEKIAEIKKLDIEMVDEITTKNAIKFFKI